MTDDTEWGVIANTSNMGKFRGSVYAIKFTCESVKEDTSHDLEDELLDKYAPGKKIDIDELSVQEEGGGLQVPPLWLHGKERITPSAVLLCYKYFGFQTEYILRIPVQPKSEKTTWKEWLDSWEICC